MMQWAEKRAMQLLDELQDANDSEGENSDITSATVGSANCRGRDFGSVFPLESGDDGGSEKIRIEGKSPERERRGGTLSVHGPLQNRCHRLRAVF